MRKKLFAILMSAMMMVTFMPAMAFAAVPEHVCSQNLRPISGTVEWGDDFTYATVDCYCDICHEKITVRSTSVTTTMESIPGYGKTGLVIADANFGNLDYAVKATTARRADHDADVAKYIDLNGAEVTVNGGNALDWDVFMDNMPANATPEAKKTANAYGASLATVKVVDKTPGATAKINIAAYAVNLTSDFATLTADEAYAATTKTLTISSVNNDDLQWFLDGVIGSATGTLKLAKTWNGYYTNLKAQIEGYKLSTGKAYVVKKTAGTHDYVIGTTAGACVYDGAEHAVTLTPSAGLDIEYALGSFDAQAGTDYDVTNTTLAWSTTPVTVKNAGTYVISYRLKRTGEYNERPYLGTITVTITPATVSAAFIQDVMKTEYGTFKTPEELLNVSGIVAADAEVMATVAAKMYAVDGFFTEVGAKRLTLVNLTQTDVVYTDAETIAMGNYTLPDYAINSPSMWLEIVQAENEVTCPTTNKVVKASKVKKAAQKVTVKTTAKFGEVKLTKVSGSANLKVQAGKIVVKKGTKKGTYKIKVRASVVGTANYTGAKITKTVTIRVK